MEDRREIVSEVLVREIEQDDNTDEAAQTNEIRELIFESLDRVQWIRDEVAYEIYELQCRYDSERKRSETVVEENGRLRRENKLLADRADDLVTEAQMLETVRSELSGQVQKLQTRLVDRDEVTTVLRYERQRADSELRDRNRELADLQKALCSSEAERTRLEQEVSAAQDRVDELSSAARAEKCEYENTVARLRVERTEFQGQLDEKSAELTAHGVRSNEKQYEVDELRERMKQLKRATAVLAEKFREEKTAADEQIAGLKDRVESAASELACANERLCNAQAAKTELERELNGQTAKIRLLKLTKGRLEQELRKTTYTVETLKETMAANQKCHDAKLKSAEDKCVAADRNAAKLERLVYKQMWTIRRLERRSRAAKCLAADLVAQDATAAEMGKSIADVLGQVDDENHHGDADDSALSSQPKLSRFLAECLSEKASHYSSGSSSTANVDWKRGCGSGTVGAENECKAREETNRLWDQVTCRGKLYK